MLRYFALLLTFFLGSAFAVEAPPLTLINHYGKGLQFTPTINANVFENVKGEIFLLSGSTSFVIPLHFTPSENEGYMRVEDGSNDGDVAFFGVEEDGTHGYLDEHIAYSWPMGSNTITFCTPQDYRKNHGCV